MKTYQIALSSSLLVDRESNSEGGQWNFDQDNRKPYPKNGPGIVDASASFEVDEITQEVLELGSKDLSRSPWGL